MTSSEKLVTLLILMPQKDAIAACHQRGLIPLGVIREMPENETMVLVTGITQNAYDWVDEPLSAVAWLVEGDYLMPAGNA